MMTSAETQAMQDQEAKDRAAARKVITDDMVERAAREMCSQEGHDPDSDYGRPYATWKGRRQRKRWESYCQRMRAALEAALNPPRTNPREMEHG